MWGKGDQQAPIHEGESEECIWPTIGLKIILPEEEEQEGKERQLNRSVMAAKVGIDRLFFRPLSVGMCGKRHREEEALVWEIPSGKYR